MSRWNYAVVLPLFWMWSCDKKTGADFTGVRIFFLIIERDIGLDKIRLHNLPQRNYDLLKNFFLYLIGFIW